MRVKKFEAKTMKDALTMVKHELGPDAVILAARDNRKAFGLAGDGSVEVTAAVSENTLHKKKFTETRLREVDREKFQRSPARMQKMIIEHMTEERLRRQAEPPKPQITRTSYIDIEDDEPRNNVRAAAMKAPTKAPQQMQRPQPEPQAPPVAESAKTRIRSAVREAWKAGLSTLDRGPAPQPQANLGAQGGGMMTAPVPNSGGAGGEMEIVSLKNEISRLQSMLDTFKQVPQTFVGAHPGAEFGINYDLSFMFQKLMEAGITAENSVEILKAAQAEMDAVQLKKRPLVDAYVAKWFLQAIQVVQQPYAGRIHCFFGGAGSGKTSTLVKMASHLVVRERKKVAILTTDSFKVGAADQLKIYCQILNVPFAIVRNAKEWEWVLAQLSNVDHILVDFPGLQLRDLEEIHLLKSLMPPASVPTTSHMVIAATAKDGDALEAARRYRVADASDVIFTNLDQSVQHGIVYNMQKKIEKPLHSFGTGNRIPEDYELATKERVLDLIFRLTRIRK